MAEGETLKNALIGAVVSLMLFFLPFSPAIGGAAAGYLQRGDGAEGAKVGAYSGAIAAVPGVVIGVLAATLFTIAPPDGGGLVFFGVVVLVAILVVGLYGVALGAAGGFLGAYLARETGESRRTDPADFDRGRERRRPENEWGEGESDAVRPEVGWSDESASDDARTDER